MAIPQTLRKVIGKLIIHQLSKVIPLSLSFSLVVEFVEIFFLSCLRLKSSFAALRDQRDYFYLDG